MKTWVSFAFVVLLSSVSLAAQSSPAPQPYRVIFDLTSPEVADQKAVLRWIKEISSYNPGTNFEVVMYGSGLDFVVSGRSTLAAEVKEALANPKVSFKVCAIAMRNQHVDTSQLLPGVGIVPDGIGELVAKQRAGWGYIKVGH